MINPSFKEWIHMGWILTLLVAIAILLLSLPNYFNVAENTLLVQTTDGSMRILRTVVLWASKIFPLFTSLLSLFLGVLVYKRRPGENMTVSFSFYLLFYATIMTGPLEAATAYWLPERPDLAIAAQSAIFPLPNIVLLLIFPNGKFEPRWTRFLVLLAIAVLLGALLIDTRELARPGNWRVWTLMGLNYAILLLSIGMQIYRYRNIYSQSERQQTKWVIFGILIWFVAMGFSSVLYFQILYLTPDAPLPWWQPLGQALWFLILCILPVAFTIAIMRSGLWDIDLIIRRTLVYTILTALLILVYFGMVILLEGVLRSLVGGSGQVATVVSTLAIATLFNPLRHRIQDFIDRRFYRKKYYAEQTLADFATAARNETDLETLSAQVVSIVQNTMQPEQTSLWLKAT